ncbi:MAG: putative metal-dependent enzyme of the double-stranded beta helix superfamily [Herminiimonas sp.]|nr:putative metal-dependent enzyme of the double-stranded beta helix superfamily [Herminiimonas sp.]
MIKAPAFEHFVRDFSRLIDKAEHDEQEIRRAGGAMLATLIAKDDWLPEKFTRSHPKYYQQYLLYCDPKERFSVVSFVWGPGQMTPIHNHTVWALIGMLHGAERGERFALGAPGQSMQYLGEDILEPGAVDSVSPTIGDIHRVANAHDDRVSISIHVYGGDIGRIRRHVFDFATGNTKDFISGYSNKVQAPSPAAY